MQSGGVGSIAVIGDSLSFRPGSWLYPFEDALQSTYGNAGAGYEGFSFQTGGGFDAGWTMGLINTDTAPHQSLDGLWGSTSAATTCSYQPIDGRGNAVSQSYTLQYVTQPGGGSFHQFYFQPVNGTYQETTSSPVISTGGAQGLGTITFAANNTQGAPWYRTTGDGPVTILGQTMTTGQPGAIINRIANGGWGVNNFLERDWTFDTQFKLMSPDLVFVWLGQNDQAYQTANAYAADIEKLVNRIKSDTPSAKICLVGTYDQGSPALPRLVDGMYEASAAEDVGFLNVYSTAGDAQFFQNSGYLDDGVHFSTAGGNYVGNFMFDAFQTDGASLPEPGSLALVGVSGLLMLRRQRRHPMPRG